MDDTLRSTDLLRHHRLRAAAGAVLVAVPMIGWGLALSAADASVADAAEAPFRVAISSRMFMDVNENDAKAAVKVWAETLAKNSGVLTKPETGFINGTEALIAAFRESKYDFAAVATDEYLALSREVATTNLFSESRDHGYGEEYVFLVRAADPIQALAELKGRSLTVLDSPRMGLAAAWLDVMLLRAGKDRAENFFAAITLSRKPTTVVLPVFFGKTDACVITRSGFNAMTELNPQLGRQLRVLAASPKLVAGLTFFRAGYTSPTKDKIMAGLRRLHETPSGYQILITFQSGEIAPLPDSELDSARDLLDAHRQLLAGTNSSKTAAASVRLIETYGAAK